MFELEYPNYEAIPSAVKHLYREKDGVYVLIQSGELKTVEDTNRLQESLRKERNDHKETKKKFELLEGLDPDEVMEKLDRYEELEAAAGGKMDDDKIEEIVEKRIKSKIAPVERELNKVKTEKQQLEETVQQYSQKEKTRLIHDHVRKAAKAENMRDTAIEDALIMGERVFEVDENNNVVTKDGVGVTPGVEPTVWLSEIKNARPHWWPESQGAGAKGGSSNTAGFASNPFSADSWNLTAQGQMLRENPDRAKQMAAAAGTTIGGARPTTK